MTAEELGRIVEAYIDPFMVMLAIAQGENPRTQKIINNGTGTLIETPEEKLLISNHHVYNRFISNQEKEPTTRLLMSGVHGTRFLDISEASVKGIDKAYDLVTLSIPLAYVQSQGKRYNKLQTWPPRRPATGMLAFLIGYPGQTRVNLGNEVGIAPFILGLPLVSVSDRHFVLSDEKGTATRVSPEELPPLTDFGGISGSAVYIWDKTAATQEEMMSLGGFVYEASTKGVVYVSHADHINADGTIN